MCYLLSQTGIARKTKRQIAAMRLCPSLSSVSDGRICAGDSLFLSSLVAEI